jgi:hypothetical protein
MYIKKSEPSTPMNSRYIGVEAHYVTRIAAIDLLPPSLVIGLPSEKTAVTLLRCRGAYPR